MNALYIKQRSSYANGRNSAYSYSRITEKGEITTISLARRSVSSPKSLMLHKGFEIITQKEFNKQLADIVGSIKL